MSSLMNYIDFPKGAVFWQILWIIPFTRSSSFSLSSPVPLMILFSVFFLFFFLSRPISMLFLFPSSSFSCCFYFFIYSSPSYINSCTFLLYCCCPPFFFGAYFITGSWIMFSSSFSFGGSSTGACFYSCFLDGCWDGASGFLFLAAEGGLSIFFFSGFVSAGSSSPPPIPNTFLTYGSEDFPEVANLKTSCRNSLVC